MAIRSNVGIVGTSLQFSILDKRAAERPVRCPSCSSPMLRRKRNARSFCPIMYSPIWALNESEIGISLPLTGTLAGSAYDIAGIVAADTRVEIKRAAEYRQN